MRSALPKVLHPICGRPMILWPLLAARAAGRGAGDRGRQPEARGSPTTCRTTSRSRSRSEPRGTGDAVAAAADADRPRRARARDQRRHAADHRRGDRRRSSPRTRRRGAGATIASMELDDPAGYGRVVRGADGSVERVVETKAAGRRHARGARDPRGQRRPLPVRRRRAARRARRARRRQRPGRALPARRAARCCSPPGRPVQAHPLPDPDARARRQRPRRPRARDRARPGAHPPRPPARRGDDRRPGEHADRGRRRRSARDTTIEPSTFLRGRDPRSARGCTRRAR